jgi:hypothetical protein
VVGSSAVPPSVAPAPVGCLVVPEAVAAPLPASPHARPRRETSAHTLDEVMDCLDCRFMGTPEIKFGVTGPQSL